MGKLWLENCTSEKIPQGQRGWSFIPLRSATWLLFAQVPREGTAQSHWSQHSQPVEGTWVGCQGHPLSLEPEKRSSRCPGRALSPDSCPCLAIQSSFYSHSQPRPQPLSALVPPCVSVHLFLSPAPDTRPWFLPRLLSSLFWRCI